MEPHRYGKYDFYKLVKPQTVDELFDFLKNEKATNIFRGHASAEWGMECSLERVINKSRSTSRKDEGETMHNLLVQIDITQKYDELIHLYDTDAVEYTEIWDKLSFMQHYGFPTKLLDFSYSPFIALYFALDVESEQNTSAVFSVDIKEFEFINKVFIENKAGKELTPSEQYEFSELEGYNLLFLKEPSKKNIRLQNQQGCFLISTQFSPKMTDCFNVYGNQRVVKYEFPSEWRFEIHKRLERMNIRSTTLFPSREGVIEQIRRDLFMRSVINEKFEG